MVERLMIRSVDGSAQLVADPQRRWFCDTGQAPADGASMEGGDAFAGLM